MNKIAKTIIWGLLAAAWLSGANAWAQAETVEEAHRKLVEADDANAERFKDVINYAAADVERLKKAERE